MSLATKTNTKWGVQGKLEATYGTPVALTPATDGLRTIDMLKVVRKYSYDGKRLGKAPGTAARLQMVGGEGRYGEFTLAQEGAGAGVAYSASVVPVPHLMMRMNCWKATVVTTGGSESVTYTPGDESDYASATIESYEGGEKYALAGCIGEGVDITAELGHIAEFKSTCKGIMAAEAVDAAIPVGLVYNSTLPAKVTAANITIGTFAPVRVQSFSFKEKLNLQDRAYDNVNGRHGGFHPNVERQIDLELLIEAAAIGAIDATHFDPGTAVNLGTTLAIALAAGATQYKKWSLAAAQAQVTDDPRETKGAIRMWKLAFALMPSSEVANDECSITFN